MINVMLDPLPEEWNGYKVNTSFRIGCSMNGSTRTGMIFVSV